MERNIRRFLKTPPHPHGKNPQTPPPSKTKTRVRPRKAGFIKDLVSGLIPASSAANSVFDMTGQRVRA
jgi:hypothetical protein